MDLRLHKEAVSSLSHFFEQWKNGAAGIVTADVKDRSVEENEMNYYKLKRLITESGYGYIPVDGFYTYSDKFTGEEKQWAFENSFWIPNVKQVDIHIFASVPMWRQETYVWGENGKSWLFHTPTDEELGEGVVTKEYGSETVGRDEAWAENTRFRAQFDPKKEDYYSKWHGRHFQLAPEKTTEAERVLTFRK